MDWTHLSILLGIHEQLGQVLVPLLLVIPCLPPLRDSLSVEDEDVEEGVEEEDGVGSDGDRVEEDGLGRRLEAVRHERRLDHDERVVDVFRVEDVTVGGRGGQRGTLDDEDEGLTGRRQSRRGSC
jgi:hypothetical protein